MAKVLLYLWDLLNRTSPLDKRRLTKIARRFLVSLGSPSFITHCLSAAVGRRVETLADNATGVGVEVPDRALCQTVGRLLELDYSAISEHFFNTFNPSVLVTMMAISRNNFSILFKSPSVLVTVVIIFRNNFSIFYSKCFGKGDGRFSEQFFNT